jgi:hypothetical protein
MTDMSLPAATFAENEFRVGNAVNKAYTVLSRNVLTFSLVTGIAALPGVLLFNRHDDVAHNPSALGWLFGGIAVSMVLGALSQAVVLYGAFEDMRGRPVDLMASFQLAWRRFLPVIGVSLLMGLLVGLASILLVFPAIMLFTAWYVATPTCVVERTGPWQSLTRSAALTKGYRWRVFGMIVLVAIVGGIGTGVTAGLSSLAGSTIGLVAQLIWNAIFGAFSAILVVVAYHDLRVAKEGIDTDQIAAVFE